MCFFVYYFISRNQGSAWHEVNTNKIFTGRNKHTQTLQLPQHISGINPGHWP